jgi:hypothetical protein
VYEHSYHPLSLLIAKSVFTLPDLPQLLSHSKSVYWWAMRYARVHQDLLEQNSATLKAHVDVMLPKAIAIYCSGSTAASTPDASSSSPPAAASSSSPLSTRLSAHLYLESCHVYHQYWQYKSIEDCLSAASRQLGVEVELTGIMGKRTRWQKDEKAQLLAKVIPSEKKIVELERIKETEADMAVSDPLLLELMPHALSLDSDVLLPSIALSSHDHLYLDAPLSISDQALLLALFENTNRANASHVTRDEKMMAYIQRILEESRSGRKM